MDSKFRTNNRTKTSNTRTFVCTGNEDEHGRITNLTCSSVPLDRFPIATKRFEAKSFPLPGGIIAPGNNILDVIAVLKEKSLSNVSNVSQPWKKIVLKNSKSKSHKRTNITNGDPAVNIYHFGDGCTDSGNFPYEPAPGPLIPQNTDIPLPTNETVQVRFNCEKAHTNGSNTFAEFISDAFKMNFYKGSNLKKIGAKKGNYVNFSLTGAAQDFNAIAIFQLTGPLTPLPSPDFASFTWQIKTFTNLLDLSSRPLITSDDIFILSFLGNVDISIMEFSVVTGIVSAANVSAYITGRINDFVNSAMANLTTLYDRGMRRAFLLMFDVPLEAVDTLHVKLANMGVFTGAFGSPAAHYVFFQGVLVAMLNSLNNAINANLATIWSDLEVARISYNDLNNDAVTNAPLNGITGIPAQAPNGDYNTIPGTGYVFPDPTSGAWPVASEAPIKNLHQLFRDDDISCSEHTYRIISKYIIDWIAPVKQCGDC